MTANVKSSTVQVIEGPMPTATSVTGQMAIVQATQENSVTTQAVYRDAPRSVVQAANKQLILGPPAITNVKSSTVQVIEAPSADPTITSVTGQMVLAKSFTENSVTAQAIYVDNSGVQAKSVNKQLILAQTLTVRVSEVTIEVIGDSSITPPVPGQRVTRFFN